MNPAATCKEGSLVCSHTVRIHLLPGPLYVANVVDRREEEIPAETSPGCKCRDFSQDLGQRLRTLFFGSDCVLKSDAADESSAFGFAVFAFPFAIPVHLP